MCMCVCLFASLPLMSPLWERSLWWPRQGRLFSCQSWNNTCTCERERARHGKKERMDLHCMENGVSQSVHTDIRQYLHLDTFAVYNHVFLVSSKVCSVWLNLHSVEWFFKLYWAYVWSLTGQWWDLIFKFMLEYIKYHVS